jgi:hypothetical protein
MSQFEDLAKQVKDDHFRVLVTDALAFLIFKNLLENVVQ